MFIDLSKAFNNVGHSKLIVKVKSYDLGDMIVEWFPTIDFEELKQLKWMKNYPSHACIIQLVLEPIFF